MEEITVSQAILEKLRCSICKDYLSCSPIKLTSNGESVCGRCLPSNDAASTYRNVILEEMISKLTFPCKFREYGCEEYLPFGKTNQHEEICMYYTLPCPVVTTCIWTGLTLDLSDHFIKNHAELAEEAPEFKIEINQDKRGIFMTTVDEISFFIKYSYNFKEAKLHFSVSYISKKVEEATYKIRLANNADLDYSVTSKGGTCVPYDINFSELSNLENITLKQYQENLGNPGCIVVTLVLHIKKHKSKEIVNYKALDHLRCSECKGYLVPPLYDCPKGIICVDCSDKTPESSLSTNEKLQVVMGLSFPCRWQECTLIELGSDIHKHEQNCKFRLRKCNFCNETIHLETADCHLTTHNCKRLDKDVVFFFTILLVPKLISNVFGGHTEKQYDSNYFYAIKNNEIIYISVKIEETLPVNPSVFQVQSQPFPTTFQMNPSGFQVQSQPFPTTFQMNPPGFQQQSKSVAIRLTCNTLLKDLPSTTIYFEHSHCKVRSITFTIDKRAPLDIALSQLPACFKSSEHLKATLNIE